MKTYMTSMRHVGMTRAAIKEGVLSQLAIGKHYRLVSAHKDPEDGFATRCRLTDLSTHVAVFQHRNGTSESLTYPEIWIQMLSGEFTG